MQYSIFDQVRALALHETRFLQQCTNVLKQTKPTGNNNNHKTEELLSCIFFIQTLLSSIS